MFSLRAVQGLMVGGSMMCGIAQAAVPTDFPERLIPKLLCISEWSPPYFSLYLSKNFGKPIRAEGEAYWFKVPDNTKLGGAVITEVFFNELPSTHLMVGVVSSEPVEAVKTAVEKTTGFKFYPALSGEAGRFESKTGSVLLKLKNNQTKWFCAVKQYGHRL